MKAPTNFRSTFGLLDSFLAHHSCTSKRLPRAKFGGIVYRINYLAQAAASFQLRAETTRRKSAALAGAKASVVQVQCICNFERRKQQLVVRLGTFTRVTFRATFFDQSIITF